MAESLTRLNAQNGSRPTALSAVTGFAVPVLPNGFIGREDELRELGALVARSRLVTLTGPPGVGKTRLAVEYLARHGTGDMVFLDLSELDHDATLDALGQAAGAVAATEMMPGLLVLDTCDQVIDACARSVPGLLREHPLLRVLATSREPLQLAGEGVYGVTPLPGADAVRLFRVRAAERNTDLGHTPSELIEVICADIDGLPLAIELASARAAVLPPAQLASRLRSWEDVLAGGDRSAPARQRSFAAAIDWSYRSLPDAERALLARLAIFEGQFRLEDVEFLCEEPAGPGDSELRRGNVLDGLAALVAKSLLGCQFERGTARYAMLGTIRRYLRTSEPAAVTAITGSRPRHVEWCIWLAERVRAAAASDELAERLDELDAHHADMDAALQWCQTCHLAADGLRLASALATFWLVRGRLQEGCAQFSAMLSPGPEVTAELAAHAAVTSEPDGLTSRDAERAQLEYGALLCASGEFQAAQAAAQRTLENHADDLASPERIRALILLGNVKVLIDPAASGTLLDEGVARAGSSGAWWTGIALALLGYAQTFTGDLASAREACTACLAAASGSPLVLVTGEIALGHVALGQGDFGTAESVLSRGLDRSRALQHPQGGAMALHGLGLHAAAIGHAELARARLDEAVTLARRTQSPVVVAQCLNAAAAIALDDADLAGARERHREVLALGERATTREITAALLGLCHVERISGDLSRAASFGDEAVTLARRVGDRTLVARAVHALGILAWWRGKYATAWAMLQEALSLRCDIGLMPEIASSLLALAGISWEQQRSCVAARIFATAYALQGRLGIPPGQPMTLDHAHITGLQPSPQATVDVQEAWAAGEHAPLRDSIAWVLRQAGPRAKTTTGWAGLTRAEHQVASLAAEGLTNRQIGTRLFVSPRTVQTHLSHVFTKLGVNSRRELAEHMAVRTEHLGDTAGRSLFRVLGIPATGLHSFPGEVIP